MSKVSKEELKAEMEKGASKITENDILKVIEEQEKIKEKFSKGPLAKFMDKVKVFIELLKDYINGNYKEIPWYMIAAITATLLYVFSPIDLIPDFIPIIGLADDALMVLICLELVEMELEKYQEWKEGKVITN